MYAARLTRYEMNQSLVKRYLPGAMHEMIWTSHPKFLIGIDHLRNVTRKFPGIHCSLCWVLRDAKDDTSEGMSQLGSKRNQCCLDVYRIIINKGSSSIYTLASHIRAADQKKKKAVLIKTCLRRDEV
jgi:hypothetical protein